MVKTLLPRNSDSHAWGKLIAVLSSAAYER